MWVLQRREVEGAEEILGPEAAELLSADPGGGVHRAVQPAVSRVAREVDVQDERRDLAHCQKQLGGGVDLGALEATVHERERVAAGGDAVDVGTEQQLVSR